MDNNLPTSVGDMGSIVVQADSTFHRETKPVCPSTEPGTLEPMIHKEESIAMRNPAEQLRVVPTPHIIESTGTAT